MRFRVPLVIISFCLALLVPPGLTGCKSAAQQDSEAKSIMLIPISLAIAEQVLSTFIDFNLNLQWEAIHEKFFSRGDNLGDLNEGEVTGNAKRIFSPLAKEFPRQLKIKLNSLQDTLSRDYVPGSPDSSNLIAIMIDKANDIRNSLEEYTNEDSSPEYLAAALASYQTYALISSLSIAILWERARAAETTPGLGKDVVGQLKASVSRNAQQYAAYLKKLYGPLFERYAKKSLLTYRFKSIPGKVDFGFESGVTYMACVSAKLAQEKCGPRSSTACDTELNAACVTKAQHEAQQNLLEAAYEKQMIGAARKDFFAIDLDMFADRMLSKANVH